jgi:hypothetical protein
MHTTARLITLLLMTIGCSPNSETNDSAADTVDNTGSANARPGLPQILLAPQSPSTTDDLVVSFVADTFDPEGDVVSHRFTWLQDGRVRPDIDSDRVDADETAHGEVWTVAVTPSDGTGDGPAASASVTIGNTAPEVDGLALRPDPAYEGSTLTPTISSVVDADDDDVFLIYRWFVNDELVAAGDVQTLDGADFDKEDRVRVEVTPDDGTSVGDTLASSTITISNSPPTTPTVSLLPASAAPGTALRCIVDVASTDADDDTLTTSLTWTRNGTVVTGTTTVVAGDSIPGAYVGAGQTWTCTLNVVDTDGAVASGSASLVVTTPVTETCDGTDEDGDGTIDEGGVCPCSVSEYGGHAYMGCTTGTTAASARTFCESYGYGMLVVETADEDAFTRGLAGGNRYWLGLEETRAGVFAWYDGTTSTYTNWDASWSQPDAPSDEPCVAGFSTGWHDAVCYSTAYVAMCEADG